MKPSLLLLLILFSASSGVWAQCPVITCPPAVAIPCSTNGLGVQVMATSNYSANISSRWLGPNNVPLASSGTATSVVSLNHAGTYTVEFKDNVSNCISSQTVMGIANSINPTFTAMSASNFTVDCVSGCSLSILNPGTSSGTPVSFAFGTAGTPPIFSPTLMVYTTPGCGQFYIMVADMSNQCISSYTVDVVCPPLPTITIASQYTPLCVGITTSLNATGATTYSWSNGANSATTTVTPNAPGSYSVSGTNSLGCTSSASIQAVNCATGINKTNSAENHIQVYPNPASAQLLITTETAGSIKYTLYDAAGKQTDEGLFDQTTSINLSAFENGVYLLRLETPCGIFYKKIPVIH